MVNIESTLFPERRSVAKTNSVSTVCIPRNINSDGAFPYDSIVKPVNWRPPCDVDSNRPISMLRAIPMSSDGAKQIYIVWVSLFFAFSRSGVTFISF